MTFGLSISDTAFAAATQSCFALMTPLAFQHHHHRGANDRRNTAKRRGPCFLPRFQPSVGLGSSSLARQRIVVASPRPSSEYDGDDAGFLGDDDADEYESEEEFLAREIANLRGLEELLGEEDVELLLDADDGEDVEEWLALLEDDDDEETFDQDGGNLDFDLFEEIEEGEEEYEDEEEYEAESEEEYSVPLELEKALLQGVVPASADVGSEALPGDWGFDPLNLASKDFIFQAQYRLLQAMPGAEPEPVPPPRPPALVMRDYREAEIRHGRLAMLAAVFWPLQEMLDRLLLDEDQFGPLLYGPVTLPYFPLLMTLIMMLLGYLDIYAKAIQDRDDIGDAFLPGDCFWDPLNMLEGAPASMKRNMQERELFNGRVAMLAFAAFVFEEATSHVPLIEIEGNQLLFVPAYEIPYIQAWLDTQFG